MLPKLDASVQVRRNSNKSHLILAFVSLIRLGISQKIEGHSTDGAARVDPPRIGRAIPTSSDDGFDVGILSVAFCQTYNASDSVGKWSMRGQELPTRSFGLQQIME